MILSAVLTSVFGVLQTLISTTVGQRVMHDLRTAVYDRLQRMSLAFFTRTRTGEVQSRIANDIGGMRPPSPRPPPRWSPTPPASSPPSSR
jgi:ATP-binding cassette subfamily B protein